MATIQQREFCKAIYEAAKKLNIISPTFVTAQACLESAWGAKKIGQYNIFGITKNKSGKYVYKVYRYFKNFHSYEECLQEHLRILQKPGYADAWPYRKNAREFAKRIADNKGSKYATDPNYYKTMCAMISSVEKIVG